MDNPKQFDLGKDGPAQQIPMIESSQLFGKSSEIMIRHEGAVYRLRITRNGKLIMNK
ncbi:MAG: hemin uptake protein HemP [Anaerohalosphaeraceae bacterium]|nr:hemin uptake protein HemP [Anaerohalosphaeraceae bacterium]